MKKRPAKPNPAQLEIPAFRPQVIIPTVMVPRGDGSFIVTAGKPQVMGEEVSTKEFSKLTGLSPKQVAKMCEEGKLAHRQPGGPGGHYFIPRSEAEARREIIPVTFKTRV